MKLNLPDAVSQVKLVSDVNECNFLQSQGLNKIKKYPNFQTRVSKEFHTFFPLPDTIFYTVLWIRIRKDPELLPDPGPYPKMDVKG
jgi:hypothetical protein